MSAGVDWPDEFCAATLTTPINAARFKIMYFMGGAGGWGLGTRD